MVDRTLTRSLALSLCVWHRHTSTNTAFHFPKAKSYLSNAYICHIHCSNSNKLYIVDQILVCKSSRTEPSGGLWSPHPGSHRHRSISCFPNWLWLDGDDETPGRPLNGFHWILTPFCHYIIFTELGVRMSAYKCICVSVAYACLYRIIYTRAMANLSHHAPYIFQTILICIVKSVVFRTDFDFCKMRAAPLTRTNVYDV